MLIARAALHFWEEPPLSGTAGSGAVFFSHCSLRCVYCQNSPIACGRAGKRVSVERLAEICLELQKAGALNVNFVTPTHYALNIMRVVRMARGKGLSVPIVWNTSGYERPEAIMALSGTVDVFLADFKYASSDLANRYSHAHDYPKIALGALDAMVETCGAPAFGEKDGQQVMTSGVIVRHLTLPGSLDDSKAVVKLLHERYGSRIVLSLMNQYTPVISGRTASEFPELTHRVDDAQYEELLDFADSLGVEDYYWQDGPAAQESFIPAWDLEGVQKATCKEE